MSVAEIVKEMYPEDLFHYASKLTEGEVKVLQRLRAEIKERIEPNLIEWYETAHLPRTEILTAYGNARIMDDPALFEGRDNDWETSQVFNFFRYFELARVDLSLATFFTVHGGLGYTTILLGGNEEQKEKYARKAQRFEAQTCFALTEPDHGSDIASGLATTAERKGDKWILNGEKRWIGGAKTADFLPVFARDVEDGKIKCFIVQGGAPGLSIENVPNKMALRLVNNGHITLNNVEVPDEDRLPYINGFKDVNRIFVRSRADVAYIAAGITAGAYNAALELTTDREQFGRKLAGFQLVQEKLARMQMNVVATMGYAMRMGEIMESGEEIMLNSALAKLHNALRMRETVALAREVCGGNGITYDTKVARFFTDAEAVYTYEGTHEINALIVGREITGGISAFV